MDETELSGPWRAAPADEDLRRTFTEAGFADEAWEPIPVPSHWRSTPAFSELNGSLLYRTSFAEADAPEPVAGAETRSWLVLDGLFYTSDVWLDGAYVGDTEGYFFPHAFEITEAMKERSEHVLALEVAMHAPDRSHAEAEPHRRLPTLGLLDQDWNPGGIWRPVRIERSGRIRIRHLRVLCQEARADVATVFVRAVVDVVEARTSGVSNDHP